MKIVAFTETSGLTEEARVLALVDRKIKTGFTRGWEGRLNEFSQREASTAMTEERNLVRLQAGWAGSTARTNCLRPKQGMREAGLWAERAVCQLSSRLGEPRKLPCMTSAFLGSQAQRTVKLHFCFRPGFFANLPSQLLKRTASIQANLMFSATIVAVCARKLSSRGW